MFKWASNYLQMPLLQQGFLRNVDGLQLVNFSLVLIGQQMLERQRQTFVSYWLGGLLVPQRGGKMTNTTLGTYHSKTPEEILYTFIIGQLHSTFDQLVVTVDPIHLVRQPFNRRTGCSHITAAFSTTLVSMERRSSLQLSPYFSQGYFILLKRTALQYFLKSIF